MKVSADEVQAACAAAGEVLAALVLPEAAGTREQWAAAATAAQRVIDVATAVQDAAIVRLAAVEPEYLEDGTVAETHHALGHVALDAPAILSGALNVSAGHAERRVAAAVALAADGPEGTGSQSGLGGLHAAMRAGQLDPYRAGVIADELEVAPPQVREAVIPVLQPWFGNEDGAHLRRRCRRALATISPDLVRQRAARTRARCGLRRWVHEPGVDHWEGTFPCEDAAHAWAAIDALAQQYVAEGTSTHLEAARGKALTDLVAASSTVQYVLTLTVPASLTKTDPGTSIDTVGRVKGDDRVKGFGSTEQVVRRDGKPATDHAPHQPHQHPGDLVEVGGLRPSENALVARGWLDTVLAHPAASTSWAPCHPDTGALRADSDTQHSGAYRPGTRLTALVKARDGRCRFPGCSINARYCDLDHVTPWPTGPTSQENLICLCRRHHRTKQRPGWHLTLNPDATTTWTDPTGRHRTTSPRDALHTLVLPTPTSPTRDHRSPPTSTPRSDPADGPHSPIEFLLEHLTAGTQPNPTRTTRAGRARCDIAPPRTHTARVNIDLPHHHRPRRRPGDPWPDDPPPF